MPQNLALNGRWYENEVMLNATRLKRLKMKRRWYENETEKSISELSPPPKVKLQSIALQALYDFLAVRR